MPQVLSPRMTRCLKLAAYNLVYRKGSENQNADCMSRLPLKSYTDEPRSPDVLMLEALQSPPMTAEELRKWAQEDSVLSPVYSAVQSGNFCPLRDKHFKPYVRRASELSSHNGRLIRGCRIVVPSIARRRALDLIHSGHRGIVAAKACARSYMWWPGIDADIEERVKNCVVCQQNQTTTHTFSVLCDRGRFSTWTLQGQLKATCC